MSIPANYESPAPSVTPEGESDANITALIAAMREAGIGDDALDNAPIDPPVRASRRVPVDEFDDDRMPHAGL